MYKMCTRVQKHEHKISLHLQHICDIFCLFYRFLRTTTKIVKDKGLKTNICRLVFDYLSILPIETQTINFFNY